MLTTVKSTVTENKVNDIKTIELEFKNVESIQVVMDALQKVKDAVGEKQGL